MLLVWCEECRQYSSAGEQIGSDDGEPVYICSACAHAAEVETYWRDKIAEEEDMTLPPEKLGDKGQRYEIWCDDDDDGNPMCVGWSDTPDGFRKAVDAHPSWTNHRAVDRRPNSGPEA